MRSISLFLALFLLISCDQKNKISVDTIITDATIYTVNNSFTEASAMAIDKGKSLPLVQIVKLPNSMSLRIQLKLKENLFIRV